MLELAVAIVVVAILAVVAAWIVGVVQTEERRIAEARAGGPPMTADRLDDSADRGNLAMIPPGRAEKLAASLLAANQPTLGAMSTLAAREALAEQQRETLMLGILAEVYSPRVCSAVASVYGDDVAGALAVLHARASRPKDDGEPW